MMLPAVETLRASRHSVWFLSADKVDRSRRVLLRKPLPGGAGDGCPGSRARPLTLGCARYHEGACGANLGWSTRAFPAGGPLERRRDVRRRRRCSSGRSAGPDAQARRREPARRRAPLMGGLGGRRETAHNGRPRRTIGRLCCSIARNAGVRYAPLVFRRSPSFPGRLLHVKRGPRPFRSRVRGTVGGSWSFNSNFLLPSGLPRKRGITTQQSNNTPVVRAKIARIQYRYLKILENLLASYGYALWIRQPLPFPLAYPLQ